MNIKALYPDEASLKSKITDHAHEYYERVRVAAGHLEPGYQQSFKRLHKGTLFIALGVAIFLGSLALTLENEFYLLGGTSIGIGGQILLFALAGFIPLSYAWKLMVGTVSVIQTFKTAVSDTLFTCVLDIFPLPISRVLHTDHKDSLSSKFLHRPNNSFWHSDVFLFFLSWRSRHKTEEYFQVLALLRQSELITEESNTMLVDDLLSVQIGNNQLFLSELSARHVTSSGENRYVKQIFFGYFASFDLDKTFTGKTFLTTEGDAFGYANRTLQTVTFGNTARTTELEWNDFEEILHVATTDPTEARYILDPDFMVDIYDWWKSKHQEIRISFIGSRMYILFPDDRIRFGGTINQISKIEIVRYLESVCIPLLHVLHLVEDVDHKFNSPFVTRSIP